jgi:hypothetical protein
MSMSFGLLSVATNSNVRYANHRGLILPKSLLSLGDVFCFVAPALQFVQVQLVGTLLATDLVLLAALPFALIRHPDRLKQKPVPTILTLGIFWLISQIATDIVRHSAPEDYLRGWIKITLILVGFIVVWAVVCTSLRRFVLYGVGAAVGGLLTLYFHPSDNMIASPWKFGLAGPISMLIVLCVARFARHRYLGILLPLLMLAVVHSFANTRSSALLCVITAVYTLFQMSTAGNQHRLGAVRLTLLAGVTGVCIFGFVALYSHYAELGVFGKYAQRKLEAQSGEGGLLLGGRGEILGSGQAILDSPLLGHGSWARDPTYSAILAEERAELGYKDLEHGKRDDLIPAHSHIFGAWVEAGLAGAAFWLYILFYVIRSLAKVSGWEPLLPLFALMGFGLLWNILFSPISPELRFVTPYFIAAMILLRQFRDPHPAFTEKI